MGQILQEAGTSVEDEDDDQLNVKSLKKSIIRILSDILQQEFNKTFNKWVERMNLCIKNGGDYFEHLIK